MQHARECLDEIVSLYQDGPQEKASELLQRITDLYFLTLEQQSSTEIGSFGDAMIRMSKSVDPIARARFAERISKATPAPVEVLRLLARDEICIARPVLQHSSGLREGDLVSLMAELSQDHLSATALRQHLTEPVTDILVARGNNDVLISLAGNVGAVLSANSKDHLFSVAVENEALLAALNARRDTASNPMSKLKKLAEAEFWHSVAETLLMAPDDTDLDHEEPAAPIVKEENEPETKEEDKKKKAPQAIPAVTKHNAAANEKALVEAARGGKVVETIEALSKITSLDHAMVEHCLFQANLPALMVLCKAHKLAASTFTSLLQLRENNTETVITDTIGLLRRYEAMTPDTAQRVIRFADKGRPETPE